MGVTYHDKLTGKTRHITDADFEAMIAADPERYPRSTADIDADMVALDANSRDMMHLLNQVDYKKDALGSRIEAVGEGIRRDAAAAVAARGELMDALQGRIRHE